MYKKIISKIDISIAWLQNKSPVFKFLNRELILLLFLATFISFIWSVTSSPKSQAKDETPIEYASADTQIPDGYVLIPIEVANYESLDSILGSYGVVDLFRVDPQALGGGKLVAKHIKILRAPQNPNRFAVLANEFDAHLILAHQGVFSVAIQNPKKNGTNFVKKSSSRIEHLD